MFERALPDWIDGFMDYSDNSEPPQSFRLWSAISVLSATLQRKCCIEWGSITFFPNMYVVLVAPSGKARKGTAMSFASEMLEDLPLSLAAESITREALIRELVNATKCFQITTEDIPKTHSSLTVFAPELTVFLGYNNHALMSDLTDWYDCRTRWTYRTKNMGTDEIHGVYVTLFGATTPELLRTTLPLDAIGGGLTSRMIFVFEPKKGKIVPDPFLTNAELVLRQKLKADLERIHNLKGVFKVTKSFVERWTEWYISQEDNPPFNDHRFSGYIERRPNHVMKLSMIVNVSRSDKMVISKEDLERAIAILEFTERKMVQTFSGVGRATNADIMTRVMTELAMRKEMTMAKLQTMFYFDADKKTLEGVIETLKSMKFITSKFLNNEIILTYLEEKHDDRAMPEGVSANRDGVPRAMLSHEKSRLTKPSGEPYLQCPNEVRSSVEENSGEAQPGLGDNTAIPRQES